MILESDAKEKEKESQRKEHKLIAYDHLLNGQAKV
jgi:hypothetical protein